MPSRLALAAAIIFACSAACIPDWDPPGGMSCADECSTSSTGVDPTSTGDQAPTTSTQDTGVDSTGVDSTGTGNEPGSSTTAAEPEEPPSIVGFDVEPDLIEDNGLIKVEVSTLHADGVRMLLETGDVIELTQGEADSFSGNIAAFTGDDNGEHVAILTPYRAGLEGEPKPAPYYIALPKPGSETDWETGNLIGSGFVVAMGVLPDRRRVELGTFYEKGEPRCFLRVRDLDGNWGQGDFMSVLPAYCTATDLTVNPETGAMHVLVDRKGDGGMRWWLAEIASWGKGAKQIGVGSLGDKALALARHPDMVAVCGAKKVATGDLLDAFTVLVRPGQDGQERPFDYYPKFDQKHTFTETIRDCAFEGDTLVMVGEAWGAHDLPNPIQRDRLTLLEYDVVTDEEKWSVAGQNLGIQSRALTLTVDDLKRYHVAGYHCLDDCEPEGDLWGFLPGGMFFTHTPLGQLGSNSGPHDIAWSPAGYMVIASGEAQGQSYTFKVEAFAPENPVPLWTFTPKDMQGLQIAFAVAVDLYGKVCAGGIGASNYPAFACIGS